MCWEGICASTSLPVRASGITEQPLLHASAQPLSAACLLKLIKTTQHQLQGAGIHLSVDSVSSFALLLLDPRLEQHRRVPGEKQAQGPAEECSGALCGFCTLQH